MTRRRFQRRLLLLVALLIVAVLAACDLNPQPLPPLEMPGSFNPSGDGGFASTDSGKGPVDNDDEVEEPSPDASAGDLDSGLLDAGDAGETNADDADAGDGGDAGDLG